MGELQNIVVVPYDSGWPQKFQREAQKITAILGQELISIHHIGSTAIPGMKAKPIIDILSVVRNIEVVETFNSAMKQLGYEPEGECGIPGRRLFFKGGDWHRTHHVHTFEPNHVEVAQVLGFRDYLIAHPEQAQRYADLKVRLAEQFPHDISSYRAGKAGFIMKAILEAQKWHAEKVEMNTDKYNFL
jgi:GrpB-like predicted nucleotidyltransferase (UPF0157 family)